MAAGATLALPGDDGAAGRYWLEVLEGEVRVDAAVPGGAGDGGVRLADGDGMGWLAGAAGAPSVLGGGDAPARLLLLALPG